MIRRLVRFILAGFCLLSLLVALGTSWLWWECRHGRGYVADGSAFGRYVMAESLSGGRTGVLVVSGWPRRFKFHVWTENGYYVEHPLYWSLDQMRSSKRFGLTCKSGRVAVFVRMDTDDPVRWTPDAMPAESAVKSSVPPWARSVGNVPHAAVIAPALLPPLLWAGVRWRRVRERRRRVRPGLCLACGYDLRHSPEKCPECGSASVKARTNPSAADVPTANLPK